MSSPFLDVLQVFVEVHELIEFGGIVDFDGEHPALVVGIVVDEFGMVAQSPICFENIAAEG